MIFPDNDGHLFAYNKTSGQLFWSKSIKDAYFPNPKYLSPKNIPPATVVSRTTPVKYLNSFLIGTIDYTSILRIDIKTGALIGKVRLSTHRFARITMSGTVYQDSFYVGTSSLEESTAGDPTYDCCSFAGTFYSINIPTMTVNWQWFTIPPSTVGPTGYSGAALWGSSPAIAPSQDGKGGVVYIATGDNYQIPDELTSCYNVTAPANWETKCNQVLAPENW